MKHLWSLMILGVLLTGTAQGFSCPGIGRFENEYDPKCQTYYLCDEANEETLYRCANGEVFDPKLKQCSSEYACTKPAFNCRNSGNYADLSDTSCRRYYNCFNFFGFYFKFAHNCLAGEQFDPVARVCSKSYDCGDYKLANEEVPTTVPTTMIPTTSSTQSSKINASVALSAPYALPMTSSEFVCTSMGLFPEPNDPNCAIYYYCLPKTGGTFTKRQYKCPNFYDPEIKKCTDEYVCPFMVTSGPTTSEGTSTPITTPSTTPSTTPTSTTTSEATTSPEDAVSLVGDFEVSEPNDHTILSEGPQVSDALTGSVKNATTSQSLEETTTSAILDNTTTNTTLDDTTTSTIIVNTTSDKTTEFIPEFVCTATGRYPNSIDPTCTEYFLCSRLHNGTFLKTPYTCPASSFFDPAARRCSRTYTCTNVIETTTPYAPTSTTEDVMTTLVDVTTENAEFVCTTTGRFPDSNDLTCKRYFLCSKLSNGTFLKTPYTCPVSNFDPINRICSNSYVCPYNTETTTVTSSSTTTEIVIDTTTEGIWDFSCYKVGRFRNMNDHKCKSYFLCNQLRNGSFIQTEYNCPTTSVFDRSIHMCSTQISCM